MKNLIKAVLAVMKEVENIEKKLNVGAGSNSYRGVADKDVKVHVGQAMRKHGLVIFTTEINPTVDVKTWEESTNWGVKQKQSVFTEVLTKYILFHESGESIELQGYGHGVDSQDKSAGKATTYALKNTLLYTFLVATGNIDDTDKTHSAELPEPVKTIVKLTEEQFNKAMTSDAKGIAATLKFFSAPGRSMTAEQKRLLTEKLNNYAK